MRAKSVEIQKLKSLANAPDEQLAYACALCTKRQKRDVLMAALPILERFPKPANRAPLLALIDHYSANGGVRDAGCYLRRLMFAALRPLLEADDLDRMLEAVATYEFLPPAFTEEAVLLRTSALVLLNDLDPDLAAFHAARLVVDPYLEEMSAEPAITALRVLASQGELVPIYQAAMQELGQRPTEVVSESLRNLTDLPVRLVPGLVARHGSSGDPPILVGLFDLLLNHRDGPQALDYIAQVLAATEDVDVYRYLTIALAASGRAELVSLLMASARFEQSRTRVGLLLEALALLPQSGETRQIMQTLEERL